MTLGQLLVLYLVAGCGVGGAVYLTGPARGRVERGFQVVSAVAFWPLYLTLLLSRGRADVAPAFDAPPAHDELACTIARVDAELEAALRSLDGWAEGVLAREKSRLDELRIAWAAQAHRVRAMDQLLTRLPAMDDPVDAAGTSERVRASRQAVQRNTERLRQVRNRTHQGLVETLAWVRELVSMIHLAQFTGAPASRAEDLVARIAAAVEGLSAVTWQPLDESQGEPHPYPSLPSSASTLPSEIPSSRSL